MKSLSEIRQISGLNAQLYLEDEPLRGCQMASPKTNKRKKATLVNQNKANLCSRR